MHRRPPLLVAFACLFLLLPVGNYVARASVRGLPLGDPARVLGAFGWVGGALLAGSFLVGIGLLAVRRWGWWLFLAYAPLLVAFDLYHLVRRPTAFNTGALAQTAFAFAAMAYFLRRDVHAPYLSATPRGWRARRRYPLAIAIEVDGAALRTRDFGARGCYVEWPGTPLTPGAEVRVRFSLGAGAFELVARVARVDAGGAGLAFSDPPPQLARLVAAEARGR